MSLIHEVVERDLISGEARHTSVTTMLLVVGGSVVGVHVLRALAVREATAATWLARRGLPADPRTHDAVVRYLRRVRWSRVLSALLLVGVCAAALALGQVWVSFLSLPFLLSVLVAESLAPEPRRGRVRVAGLERRSRSYFGPPRHIALARAVLVAGSLMSLVSATQVEHGRRYLVVHGIVTAVGALAFEAALHRTSSRALPDRQPDLMVDTAMRVASARTATAAALAFGAFGWFLSSSVLLGLVSSDGLHPARVALGVVFQVVLYLALGLAVSLLQPLSSWRPREAA